MLPHAVAKMNGPAAGLHLRKFRRDWLVLEECIQPRSDTSDPCVVVIIRVRRPSSQLSAVILPESVACSLDIVLWHAVLLHESEPGNPVCQPLLMCGKARRVFGFSEEALRQVPWRSLVLPIALDNALPLSAATRLCTFTGWRWAFRAWFLGAGPPVRQSRPRIR